VSSTHNSESSIANSSHEPGAAAGAGPPGVWDVAQAANITQGIDTNNKA
jgi:hypothetical protein